MTFYNVDDLEPMAEDEHFMATDCVWDPTGRCAPVSFASKSASHRDKSREWNVSKQKWNLSYLK